MKRHRVLVLAVGCLVLTVMTFCQDGSTNSASEGAYRVGGSVKPPRLIYSPDPEYPEKAREAHHVGIVRLSIVVGANGRPHDIKVVGSPSSEFDDAAVDAVKKWKFEPATKYDKPVAVQINVDVTFRLNK